MKSIITLLLLGLYNSAFSQVNSIHFLINPTFGVGSLHLADSPFHANDSNKLQIDVLKFYISNFQFLKKGKVVLEEKGRFHLVDAADEKSFSISIENKQNIDYDELKFNLGIDSTTNVSGAMGGDLDPTRGMYWAWQSGYINFKLEGTSKLCNTRNNEFTFHLGGYQQPFYALQTLSFTTQNAQKINLKLDVREILMQIDLAKQNHIMSPSTEATMLSKIVAASFKISEN
ncbi:MAG: MbnP family protein [Bacteroidia bacterium]